MNIFELKYLPYIVSTLSLIISIITFTISRIEKRKKLFLTLYISHSEKKFLDEINNSQGNTHDFLILTISNPGLMPINLNKESIIIKCKGKELKSKTEGDWYGLKNFPPLLTAGQYYEVGLELSLFENYFKINNSKDTVKVEARIFDYQNQFYGTPKGFFYHCEVAEIIHNSDQ